MDGSMWSKAGKPRHRASGRRGFTLVEALVALVVAGFLLPSLARALGGAWTATRTPMEMISAMVLAGDAAAGADDGAAEARRLGFTVQRSERRAEVLVLPSGVAPAPGGTEDMGSDGADALKPQATPGSMKLALPKGLGTPGPGIPGAANLILQSVSVVVLTPAGRRIALDAVRLDGAPR